MPSSSAPIFLYRAYNVVQLLVQYNPLQCVSCAMMSALLVTHNYADRILPLSDVHGNAST